MSEEAKQISEPEKAETDADVLEEFCVITGSSKEMGLQLLEMCNGNLESAVNLFLDSGGVGTKSISDSTSTSREDINPGVRAPIPQHQGVLVEGGYDWLDVRALGRRTGSVFDPFRSFELESRHQEAMSSTRAAHLKTLEDLFRPPIDITFKGTFTQVRDAGVLLKRWILVDVQNVLEFQCQCLNRDIWSHKAVRKIIDANFLLWQVYNESGEGQRFTTFYKVTAYPYVAVIDPRTGENMRVWNNLSCPAFVDQLKEFLAEHPRHSLGPPGEEDLYNESETEEKHTSDFAVPSGSRPKRERLGGDSPREGVSVKRKVPPSIIDANEEEQIKAAIHASIMDIKHQPTKIKIDTLDKGGPSGFDINSILYDVTNNQTGKDKDKCSNKNNSTDISDGKCASSDKYTNEQEEPFAQGPSPPESDAWKEYLGNQEDPKFNLVIRYPDASREELILPATSQVQAVIVYVATKGYSEDEFDLLTYYPKRFFSRIAKGLTFLDIGFSVQETIFVHPK